ncbi:TetR/AcrR family transcriptional regulator [Jatrophihabitans sp.]|uniref:TetR/AcrR family transcriptional regulator n=1 Tax=Jatrophihabitans sp. TaxID=1932789 RepID=UPI0030C691EB|nr:TetR family transcriptional regulator [Jatrophihabitans sp.]
MSDDLRDGRSTRWDPHRRERRTAIITAAIAAIEEHGPDALTGQIADKAGVPRTHVYRHFDGKQALDLAVSRHAAKEIGESIRAGLATRGSAREVIQASISQHLSWIEEHPNLYRFLAQHAYAVARTGSPADDAKAAFAAELTRLLEGYLRLFGLETTPAERVVVGVVGLVDTTAAWWLEHRDITRAALTAELADQVWLLIDRTATQLGLDLDPDAVLPELGCGPAHDHDPDPDPDTDPDTDHDHDPDHDPDHDHDHDQFVRVSGVASSSLCVLPGLDDQIYTDATHKVAGGTHVTRTTRSGVQRPGRRAEARPACRGQAGVQRPGRAGSGVQRPGRAKLAVLRPVRGAR